jgi:hypothetical protein
MRQIIFALFCVAVGALGSFYAQPYVQKNGDLILIFVTVFTVFAGFLIAIIALVGDPILIPEGSWRIAELGRDKMDSLLFWHTALFTLYLITVGLLFVGVVLERALDEYNYWRIWVERGYLFIGITSFLFTFALPRTLMALQRARYDAETERRRRAVLIPDDNEKA